jgi:adenylate kinase
MNKLLTTFLGKPNSGKGTLLDDLSVHYKNTEVISFGGTLRAIDPNTPLGKEVHPYLLHGEYVPRHLISELLYNKIKNASRDILFLDHFTPSYLAEVFHGRLPDGLIALLASDEICLARAEKRNREDDIAIQNRLSIFKKTVQSEIDEYKNIVPSLEIAVNNETAREVIKKQAIDFLSSNFGI